MKAAWLALVVVTFVAVASDSGVLSHGIRETPFPSVGVPLFRDIARRQNPSVVSIMTRSRGRPWDRNEEGVFRSFGLVPPAPGDRVRRLAGSGFLITTDGEILTNRHIIEGADTIEVGLLGDERKRYRAVRVGSDPLSDTALIPRSKVSDLPVPPDVDGALVVKVVAGSPADEAELAVGDIVRAINHRAIHSAADGTRELRFIQSGRPIFLLVWRNGTEVFLRMRRPF